jgi:hypothetical protein
MSAGPCPIPTSHFHCTCRRARIFRGGPRCPRSLSPPLRFSIPLLRHLRSAPLALRDRSLGVSKRAARRDPKCSTMPLASSVTANFARGPTPLEARSYRRYCKSLRLVTSWEIQHVR